MSSNISRFPLCLEISIYPPPAHKEHGHNLSLAVRKIKFGGICHQSDSSSSSSQSVACREALHSMHFAGFVG